MHMLYMRCFGGGGGLVVAYVVAPWRSSLTSMNYYEYYCPLLPDHDYYYLPTYFNTHRDHIITSSTICHPQLSASEV